MLSRKWMIFAAAVSCVSVASATPSIVSGISVSAESRGLILSLSVEGSGESFSYKLAPVGKSTVVKISGKGIVCQLDKNSFGEFAPVSPVSAISVHSDAASTLIDVTVKGILSPSDVSIKKLSGKVAFLLSRTPHQEYSWNYSRRVGSEPVSLTSVKPSTVKSMTNAGGFNPDSKLPPVSAAKQSAKSDRSVPTKVVTSAAKLTEEPKKSAAVQAPAPLAKPANKPEPSPILDKPVPAVISGFKILKRGDVEVLTISADRYVPVSASVGKGFISAVFENAVPSVPSNAMHSLHDKIFGSPVFSTRVDKKGTRIVTVKIPVNPSVKSHPVIISGPGILSAYATVPDTAGLSVWTSGGLSLSFHFEQLKNPAQTTASKLAIASPSMIVDRDNVNVRSKPETGLICKTVGHGTHVLINSVQNGWSEVKFDDGVTGWVKSSMLSPAPVSSVATELAPGATRTVSMSSGSIPKPAVDSVLLKDTVNLESDSALKKGTHAKVYTEYGRDPFLPIDQCEFLQSNLPSVEKLTLVGILYDNADRIALFEDKAANGEPFAMRENAPVKDGNLVKIKKNSVVFLLNEAGFSRTFELELQNGVEAK